MASSAIQWQQACLKGMEDFWSSAGAKISIMIGFYVNHFSFMMSSLKFGLKLCLAAWAVALSLAVQILSGLHLWPGAGIPTIIPLP